MKLLLQFLNDECFPRTNGFKIFFLFFFPFLKTLLYSRRLYMTQSFGRSLQNNQPTGDEQLFHNIPTPPETSATPSWLLAVYTVCLRVCVCARTLTRRSVRSVDVTSEHLHLGQGQRREASSEPAYRTQKPGLISAPLLSRWRRETQPQVSELSKVCCHEVVY